MDYGKRTTGVGWLELVLGLALVVLVGAYSIRQHASVVPLLLILCLLVAVKSKGQRFASDSSPVRTLVSLVLFGGPMLFVAVVVWRPQWTPHAMAALAACGAVLYVVGRRIRRNLNGSI